MSKRKLPESITTASEITLIEPYLEDGTTAASSASSASQQLSILPETPPRRIQKGSPADIFLTTLPSAAGCAANLTCDLALIPKDQYNKRRTLIAVVVAVEQIKTKGNFSRRNVTLRDAHNECEVCVWGNHTHLLNESSIGRPVTLNRICLTEFLERVTIHMAKDSSVNLGSSPETAPLMQWFNQSGHASVSVAVALELLKSDIIAITGILAQIASAIITNKDGQTEDVTTLYIAAGPPSIVLTIDFVNPKKDKIEAFQVQQTML